MIYLDNAATTMVKPPEVIDAVMKAMTSLGNSGRGSHEEALEAGRIVFSARSEVSELFSGYGPSQVAFTANSTEALNIAIFGLLGSGDHIISTDLEHNSVLRPLYALQEQGAELSFLPANDKGQISLDKLEHYLQPNTKAVVITHASNVTGDVLELEQIGRFCSSHGLLFILDASQTAGVFPIDMHRQGIDVVCFTGHKSLLGPTGTGGLCFKSGLDIKTWKRGGTGVQSFLPTQPQEYPTRLEAGTLNIHGLAGLEVALRLRLAQGITSYRVKELSLARHFYEEVRSLPQVKLYGDFTTAWRAPLVTLNLGSEDAAVVSDLLQERFHIATRPGAHCAPRLHQALKTVEQGAVRFSWSGANSLEETNEAVRAVRILAEELG